MCPVYAMPTRPSPRSERLGTPNNPAIRFTRGPFFEASLVRVCYGLSGCSPPWTDLTGVPQPPGAFTSRLPTGWSPVPPLDMTTTATGLLCWRDFHPQEWQLASLHQNLLGHRQGALGFDRSWPRRDGFLQGFDAARHEGAAPEPNRILPHPEGLGDLAAGPAQQGQQDRPRPVGLAAIPRVAQGDQPLPLLFVYHNR